MYRIISFASVALFLLGCGPHWLSIHLNELESLEEIEFYEIEITPYLKKRIVNFRDIQGQDLTFPFSFTGAKTGSVNIIGYSRDGCMIAEGKTLFDSGSFPKTTENITVSLRAIVPPICLVSVNYDARIEMLFNPSPVDNINQSRYSCIISQNGCERDCPSRVMKCLKNCKRNQADITIELGRRLDLKVHQVLPGFILNWQGCDPTSGGLDCEIQVVSRVNITINVSSPGSK